MFIGYLKSFKKDLDSLLSMMGYRPVVDEDISINKKYSEAGNLHLEKNNSNIKWFKGSRDRGFRGSLAAWFMKIMIIIF